jgi:hypothetical protein
VILDHGRDCRCPVCECGRRLGRVINAAMDKAIDAVQSVQPSSLMPMTVRDVECLGGPKDGEKLAVQEGQTVARVARTYDGRWISQGAPPEMEPVLEISGIPVGHVRVRIGTYAYDAARELLVWQGEA